ncbi:MAG: NAD(+)/NADH kinase [Nitrospirales bacterium]
MSNFTTFGIITKPFLPDISRILDQVQRWVHEQGKATIVDNENANGIPNKPSPTRLRIEAEADLLIVLGGDGTMLSGARLVERRSLPILGVNMGGLGFLTETTFEDLPKALTKIVAGEFQLDTRLMLHVELHREGKVIETYSALNDMVISKGHLARMIATKVWVDQAFMTNLRGDGLLVATPTGSTAYSLSAGGPILDPRLEVLLINPICPHTLSHRPFLASSQAPVTIELTSPEGAMATIDGQIGTEMSQGDMVKIRASPHRTQLIRFPDRNYFEVLRSKLKWGDG